MPPATMRAHSSIMAAWRRMLVLPLVVAPFTLSAPHAAPVTAPAPTVVAAPRGAVELVAQDATQVAWCETSTRKGAFVGESMHVTTIRHRTDRTWPLRYTYCPSGGTLALAGRQMAMAGFADAHGGGIIYDVSALSGGHGNVIVEPTIEYGGPGSWYRGLTSDGANLYFSILNVEGDDNFSVGTCPCRFTVTGGGVFRITGKHYVRLKNLPPAAEIGAGDGLLALVEPEKSWTGDGADGVEFPRAATDGRVEIVRASDGRLSSSFRPHGIVRAIAVSRRHVVLVVENGSAVRMEWRNPATGSLERAVALPGPVAPLGAVVPLGSVAGVSTSGDLAVTLHGDHIIWVVDLRTGKRLTLDRGPAHVVGLSVVGRRLVWGERTAHSSHILQLTVPASRA